MWTHTASTLTTPTHHAPDALPYIKGTVQGTFSVLVGNFSSFYFSRILAVTAGVRTIRLLNLPVATTTMCAPVITQRAVPHASNLLTGSKTHFTFGVSLGWQEVRKQQTYSHKKEHTLMQQLVLSSLHMNNFVGFVVYAFT